MSDGLAKEDMLKLRVDASTSALLDTARAYLKLDRSKFIREKAEAVIASHEQTHFSRRDWEAFFSLLDKPAVPTERMKAAVARYRDIV